MIVDLALEQYERYLEARGNRQSSIATTMTRLRTWQDLDVPVEDVAPTQVARWYAGRCAEVATDTHRGELAEVKTFWRWIVKQRFVRRSPAEHVEPVGRRHKGKPQLRKSEAQAFAAAALRLAGAGDDGALGALMVLLLGFRSSEIWLRRVRDVDVTSDGVLLWIDEGKSEAAARYTEVPELLATHLVRQAAGRGPGEWLFTAPRSASGHRGDSWLLGAVRRICGAADVPRVCAHGLRGTWATLTTAAGVSAHVVARELGHTSPAVAREHYIQSGADEQARVRAMMRLIDGGLGDSVEAGGGSDCPEFQIRPVSAEKK